MGRKVIEFYSGGFTLLAVLIVMFASLALIQRVTASRVPPVAQAAGWVRSASVGAANTPWTGA